VQPVDVIDDSPFGALQYRLIDVDDVADDRPNPALPHPLIGSIPHPTAYERFAVGNGFNHLVVPRLRVRSCAVTLSVMLGIVRLVGKRSVPDFISRVMIRPSSTTATR
jgi:hypothetical protein